MQIEISKIIKSSPSSCKLIQLFAAYTDTLCCKQRFKLGALTGKNCQKWEDFISIRRDWVQ